MLGKLLARACVDELEAIPVVGRWQFTVDTVPGRDNELYVWQPLVTYMLITVTSLPEGRTSLKVRAEVFVHPLRWLYGHLVASKQITKAIALAYDKPPSGGESLPSVQARAEPGATGV